MAKIRNVSGNDLIVPALGGRLVLAGQVVELDAADVFGFTQQTPNWEPADKPAQAAHNKADAALKAPAKALTADEARATADLPPLTTDTTPES